MVTAGTFYIITERTRQKLEFQFYPKQIDVSRVIKLAELTIIGRNFPIYQYMGGAKEISFDIDFVAVKENRKDVIEKCLFLESLGANDGVNSIERVYIIFGELYKRQKWIVKDFTYSLTLFDKEYQNYPKQAVGKITFVQAPDTNLNRSQIQRV